MSRNHSSNGHAAPDCKGDEGLPGAVVYRDVAGAPGYRVGDDGSVWSCRYASRWGTRFRERWRQLRPKKGDRYGHLSVTLPGRIQRYVHALVLEAFVGPCPPGMQCRHLDGNPRNNRLDNLCWGTPVEDAQDKRRHGTLASLAGKANGRARLTEEDVREIRRLGNEGRLSSGRIALRFRYRVLGAEVRKIIRRETWKHVSEGGAS